MLARVIGAVGCAVVMTVVFLALGQPAAQAGGGPSGGDPIGSVTCGQAHAPSCFVTAGTPGSGGQPAGKPGSPLAAAGPGGCTRSQFGCVPPGCTINQNTLACPLGIPGAGGGRGVPPPGVLGQVARRLLALPSPVIRSSPAPGDLQLVHLPVWLWVNRAVWVPRSKTAAVPGEQVTATAIPVSVTWRMGDGSVVTCRGPGIPYSRRYSPASASPDCGHIYGRSSAGQPRGAYRVAATITWDVTWQATGGAGGTLPPLFSTAAAAFRVAESQTVNTAGGSR
jgi:hypothetical protein